MKGLFTQEWNKPSLYGSLVEGAVFLPIFAEGEKFLGNEGDILARL